MQFMTTDGYDRSRSNTYKFLGLDRGHYTYKGEFEDMYNMSTDEYPCAAPRSPRVTVCDFPGEVQAVAAPDISVTNTLTGFTGIAGEHFYYNGVIKSGIVTLSASRKWTIERLVTAYVLNGYDSSTNTSLMYAYDINTDKFVSGGTTLNNLIVTAGKDRNGNYLAAFDYKYEYIEDYTASDEGSVIKNSDYFDQYFKGGMTCGSSNFFEQAFTIGQSVAISGFPSTSELFGQVWAYSTTNEDVRADKSGSYNEFNTVDTDAYSTLNDFTKYQVCSAVVKGFDTVTRSVSGAAAYRHKIYFTLLNKYGDEVDFADMTTAYGSGTYWCSGVTVSSITHVFENIAVHHGRLWGILPTGTMIYGSASDDMFDYTSVDDYGSGDPLYVRISSSYPGKYTGMAEFGLDLLLFKDDCIEIVSGDNQNNYTQSVIHGIGCIDRNSIQITPGGVIFLAYNGFYLYNGSQFPTRISNKLYETKYFSAVSGFDGFKYYACATRADGVRELLTYDTRYSLWNIQDSTVHNSILGNTAVNAVGMFRFKGDFYIADTVCGGLLRYDSSAAEKFRWSFTSVKTHNNTLDNKALTEIWLRAECIDGGNFTVSTSVDGGEFVVHSAHSSPNITVYKIPIRMNNGSSFRYRVFGKGKVIFYEIELHTPTGGRQYADYERDTSGDTEHEIIPDTTGKEKLYLI